MSVSGAGSDDRSRSWIDDAQHGYMKNLWSGGQNLMDQQNFQMQNGMGQSMNQLGADLQGGMQGMFGGLGQTAAGTSQAMQGLGQMGQVGGGNPYLQQNMDALGSGIQKQVGLLNQQLGGQAQMGGNFGGGRMGVMQGQLGEGALDAYQQGASSLMNQSAQQSLQANTAMGGLQTQAAMGGMQGANSIFQMGMNPMMAQWLPMQMQRGMIGSNIMRGDSSGDSDSFGAGIGFSGASN